MKSDSQIHLAFTISLFIKGVYAALEIAAGILLMITSQATILSFVTLITQGELNDTANHTGDTIARHLLRAASEVSISGQHFIAAYLLSHGVIKLFLVAGLLQKKQWAYPLSLAVFAAFIIYQLYRFSFTGSLWLLFLTAFDVLIIILITIEYRNTKKRHHKSLTNTLPN